MSEGGFDNGLPDQTTKEVVAPESCIRVTAEKMIGDPIPLITDKAIVSPSGDKRDFVSLSPYFHKTEGGGLVYKDGEVNPEASSYLDSQKLVEAVAIIFVTSLAAKSAEVQTEKEKFARGAVSALKAWFVDDKTRMTPSLEYAGMKIGETTGNFYGIIEGQRLVHVIKGVNYLKESGLIDPDTQKGVEGWFDQYLNWLLTSEKGIHEKAMSNNHGTFYDVQVAHIADFLGKTDLARGTIAEAKERIKSQISPDGEMPLEAGRAIPYDYQLYNLYAFSELATLGQKYDIDLWNWETDDGGGLRKAFEFFVRRLESAGDQPFKMNRSGEFYLSFRAASKAYGNQAYWELPSKYYTDPLAEDISQERFGKKGN